MVAAAGGRQETHVHPVHPRLRVKEEVSMGRSGWTLVELLVVIAIIAIPAVLAYLLRRE